MLVVAPSVQGLTAGYIARLQETSSEEAKDER